MDKLVLFLASCPPFSQRIRCPRNRGNFNSHVRELRKILAKPEAKAILLDPHKSLQDAINVAHQDDLAKSWLSAVSAAVSALDRMGIRDVKKLTRDDEFVLKKLRDLAMERLADRAALIDRSRAR